MAVTLTPAELAGQIGLDAMIAGQLATATRLLAVASARVEQYAPAAPFHVQNEAGIRFAAYLKNTGGNLLGFSKTSLSGLDAELVSEHGPMFRRCGAKALLKPWAPRNLGVC